MVNWAHVHLMINHFPVVGVLGAILLLLYALVRKSDEVMMVSLGAFVLIALVTIPVFFTGEGAEDVVKKLPGVTEQYIGRHEEMAEYSLTLMEILGMTCLVGLVFIRKSGHSSEVAGYDRAAAFVGNGRICGVHCKSRRTNTAHGNTGTEVKNCRLRNKSLLKLTWKSESKIILEVVWRS